MPSCIDSAADKEDERRLFEGSHRKPENLNGRSRIQPNRRRITSQPMNSHTTSATSRLVCKVIKTQMHRHHPRLYQKGAAECSICCVDELCGLLPTTITQTSELR